MLVQTEPITASFEGTRKDQSTLLFLCPRPCPSKLKLEFKNVIG